MTLGSSEKLWWKTPNGQLAPNFSIFKLAEIEEPPKFGQRGKMSKLDILKLGNFIRIKILLKSMVQF